MLLAVPIRRGPRALHQRTSLRFACASRLATWSTCSLRVPSVVYGFGASSRWLPVLHPIADHLSSWLSGHPVIGAVFAGPFFGPSYFAAGSLASIVLDRPAGS